MINLSSISLHNSVGIITLEDNLAHTYMIDTYVDVDNSLPVGYAQVIFPYNRDILQYWTTYNGIVIIHSKLLPKDTNNQAINNLPNSSLKSKSIEQIKTHKDKNKIVIEQDYNYSFIGRIHKVKHAGKRIIVKLENLGWKFLQKMPMDFRKTYVASKPVGDAFQDICSFMGVECAYNKEELNKYSFAADGYSIELNGEIIEETPSYLAEVKSLDQDLADGLSDGMNESGDLPNMKKNENDTQQQNIQNNQQNDTLKSTENKDTIDEDFEEKIQNLFQGNTIYDSDLISNVLNYGNITSHTTTNEEQS